jgi:hypothetical protein
LLLPQRTHTSLPPSASFSPLKNAARKSLDWKTDLGLDLDCKMETSTAAIAKVVAEVAAEVAEAANTRELAKEFEREDGPQQEQAAMDADVQLTDLRRVEGGGGRGERGGKEDEAVSALEDAVRCRLTEDAQLALQIAKEEEAKTASRRQRGMWRPKAGGPLDQPTKAPDQPNRTPGAGKAKAFKKKKRRQSGLHWKTAQKWEDMCEELLDCEQCVPFKFVRSRREHFWQHWRSQVEALDFQKEGSAVHFVGLMLEMEGQIQWGAIGEHLRGGGVGANTPPAPIRRGRPKGRRWIHDAHWKKVRELQMILIIIIITRGAHYHLQGTSHKRWNACVVS